MTGNDQDVFRKVGRGGAGNFISVKDGETAPEDKVLLFPCVRKNCRLLIPESNLIASQDLERQDTNHIVTTVQDSATGTQPIRAGRGGAGNYMDPSQLPDAEDKNRISKEVSAAVTSSLKKNPFRAMGGRGGAGNWAGEDMGKREEEEGKSTAEELERQVKEEVEKGLKVPEKVHHGREKEIR